MTTETNRSYSDELFEAFDDNDEETFVKLLESGVSSNSCLYDSEQGNVCILSNAVRKGSTRFVDILLKYGADPNYEDEDGETPLFEALFSDCDTSIQESLYRYGANKNHKNKAGNTPFIQLVIRCSDDQAYNFQSTTLFHLLECGTDFQLSSSRDQKLIHFIPLIHRCHISKTDTSERHICIRYLEVLTQNGLSVHLKDGSRLTPLHYASMACCEGAVQYLIDHGAKTNARTISGQLPLHFLGQNGDRPGFQICLRLLLDSGSSLKNVDNQGRNILHYITTSNKVSKLAIETVINEGMNPDLKDNCGLTPLHLCVIPSIFVHPDELEDDEEDKTNISNILTFLVYNGASVNAVDKNGLTPLHYSLRYELKQEIIGTLLELGADTNLRTMTGETALHRATLYPNLLREVLNRRLYLPFLKAGADVNICDFEGRSPVQYAVISKRTSLFKALGIIYCRETDPLPCKIYPSGETDLNVFLEVKMPLDGTYSDEKIPEQMNIREQAQNRPSGRCKLSSDDSSSDCSEQNITYSRSNTIDLSEDTYTDLFGGADEECIGEDHMWCDCPLLQTVVNHNKMVDTVKWIVHCEQHRQSLANYMELILNTNNMGLYLDITENNLVAETIQKLLEKLAFGVKQKNTLFECELQLAGSWKEGTKIVSPDEFDFKWILTKFSTAFDVTESNDENIRSYVKFRLKEQYKDSLFNIDIVPTLAPPNWIPRHINNSKKMLQNFGLEPHHTYSVVLKTPDSRFVQNWNTLFRISLSDVEVAIFKSIPASALKGYILVKSLINTLYFPQIYVIDEDYYRKRFITTYIIKTCFLHELEDDINNISHTQECPDHLAKIWALKIVNRIWNAMDCGHLEPYFFPGVNLLVNNSLKLFNNKLFYTCEIDCIQHLLQTGIATLCIRHGDDEFKKLFSTTFSKK
ncbi:ANKRD28 [Mytilus coruscus]|uniref:ANKRD28 n=1 Tax=Mytilus coruscus TaxID=42192 RepID=A0A6J8CYT6_MYTCO|nr:ANKRD28 [Mytilus coruscus]